MKYLISLALASGLLLGGVASAKTEQCRDAKGRHFVRCPGKPAAAPARAEATPAKPGAASRLRAMLAPRHAAAHAAPAGAATAKCKDGTLSYSKQHVGACSRHGGVASWK